MAIARPLNHPTTLSGGRIQLPDIAVDALREHMKRRLAKGGGELYFRRLRARQSDSQISLAVGGSRYSKRPLNSPRRTYAMPGTRPIASHPLRMFALRHTANALMGHIGVPIEVASDRMGHSSIRMTVDVYGHRYEGSDQIVADKLDTFFGDLLAGKTGCAVAGPPRYRARLVRQAPRLGFKGKKDRPPGAVKRRFERQPLSASPFTVNHDQEKTKWIHRTAIACPIATSRFSFRAGLRTLSIRALFRILRRSCDLPDFPNEPMLDPTTPRNRAGL